MKTTLKDIAKATGLSVKTVSLCVNGKAVNPETRKKVLEIAKKLDYHPNYMARQLAKGGTDSIGFFLAIPPDRFSMDHFFIELFEYLAQDVQRYGKTLSFIYFDDSKLVNPELIYEYTRSGRLEGAIFFGSLDSNIFKIMSKEKFPSVLLQQEVTSARMGCVSVDNFRGGQDAVKYLMSLGYKSIGIIGKDQSTHDCSRLYGAIDTLNEANLQPIVLHTEFNDMKSGYKTMSNFLENNPSNKYPEAWFALTDVVAFGAIKALKEKGFRTPEDVGIIGFDDARIIEFMEPPLTTMRNPKVEISSLAVSKLMGMISGQITRGTKTLINAELIERASCRKV